MSLSLDPPIRTYYATPSRRTGFPVPAQRTFRYAFADTDCHCIRLVPLATAPIGGSRLSLDPPISVSPGAGSPGPQPVAQLGREQPAGRHQPPGRQHGERLPGRDADSRKVMLLRQIGRDKRGDTRGDRISVEGLILGHRDAGDGRLTCGDVIASEGMFLLDAGCADNGLTSRDAYKRKTMFLG